MPKHAFICWLTIMNRLPTKDRLLKWGLNVDVMCLLCGAAEESRDHVFFSCPFAKEFVVWCFDTLWHYKEGQVLEL